MPAMAARPLVAVLDTNVVIAGLLWEGPPYSLLVRVAQRRDLVLATSPKLMDELAETPAVMRFARRIAAAATSVEQLIAAYRDATVLVTPREVPAWSSTMWMTTMSSPLQSPLNRTAS